MSRLSQYHDLFDFPYGVDALDQMASASLASILTGSRSQHLKNAEALRVIASLLLQKYFSHKGSDLTGHFWVSPFQLKGLETFPIELQESLAAESKLLEHLEYEDRIARFQLYSAFLEASLLKLEYYRLHLELSNNPSSTNLLARSFRSLRILARNSILVATGSRSIVTFDFEELSWDNLKIHQGQSRKMANSLASAVRKYSLDHSLPGVLSISLGSVEIEFRLRTLSEYERAFTRLLRS